METDAKIVDLLKIAFCKVLIRTANVMFGHQSMSFKKVGRQRELFAPTPRETVHDAFIEAADEIATSLKTDRPCAEGHVFVGDSRAPQDAVPKGSTYSCVITSPPYPNRMSYIRELRPYMYWLGFLENGRQAGELDWRAIGGTWGCATSLLGTWQPSRDHLPYNNLDQIVASIRRRQEALGRYVHKYFDDIQVHLANLKAILLPRARCHYVVGNSKFYDTLVPVEEIYAALFADAGYLDIGIEAIRKRTSKKELFEFLVSATRP
jgi:hypothetical protein